MPLDDNGEPRESSALAAPGNNSVLAAALDYARRGWSVVPAHVGKRDAVRQPYCTCSAGRSCASHGKHPAVSWTRWQNERADEAQLRAWFAGAYAGYGVGLITGAASGFFVVDVDMGPGKAGEESLHALQMANDDLPPTVRARTGGGGRHLLFRQPDGVRIVTAKNVLGRGVDVRGDGGFIVAPPSSHLSGNAYAWDAGAHPSATDIAAAPDWLVELVREDGVAEHKASGGGNGSAKGEVERNGFGLIVDGREAYMYRLLVAQICEYFEKNGAAPTAEELFASGWPVYSRHVKTRDRTKTLEQEARGETLMRNRVAHVLRMERNGQLKVVENIKARLASGNANASANTAAQPTGAQASEPNAHGTDDEDIAPVFIDRIDESAIPARRWIVPGLALREVVTLVIAPPGVGKSTVTLTLQLAVASGGTPASPFNHDRIGFTGHKIAERVPVWCINNEDNEDELRRRLAAAAKHFALDWGEVKDHVAIYSGTKRPLKIVKRDDKRRVYMTDHVDKVIGHVRKHSIGVVIIDPLVEVHEASENDNGEMAVVGAALRRIATETGAAVIAVHHTNKPPQGDSGGRAGNMNTARGAGSIIGVARIAVTLFNMSETDASTYGVPLTERHKYVRLDDAKANVSLVSPDARWFRRENVDLANGDKVGVLRPIDLGAAKRLTLAQAKEMFAEMRRTWAGGEPYSEQPNAKGRYIVPVMCQRYSVTKHEAARTLASWLEKRLVERAAYDSKNKKYGLRVVRDLDAGDDAEAPEVVL